MWSSKKVRKPFKFIKLLCHTSFLFFWNCANFYDFAANLNFNIFPVKMSCSWPVIVFDQKLCIMPYPTTVIPLITPPYNYSPYGFSGITILHHRSHFGYIPLHVLYFDAPLPLLKLELNPLCSEQSAEYSMWQNQNSKTGAGKSAGHSDSQRPSCSTTGDSGTNQGQTSIACSVCFWLAAICRRNLPSSENFWPKMEISNFFPNFCQNFYAESEFLIIFEL